MAATTTAGSFSGRTAWGRNLAAPVRDFLSTETGGAVFLLCGAVAALLWANSPWSDSYESVWTANLSIQLSGSGISMDLRHWVNEGLMTFFFLCTGLEARREIDVGSLRDRRRLVVIACGALGGMAVAVLIYLAINAGGAGAHGWGAAMSTDTAFALGVLALVASRAGKDTPAALPAPGGTRARVRLLTLAVFDDLIALVVIATAYSGHVSLMPLAIALALFMLLLVAQRLPTMWPMPAAVALVGAIWVALLKSGIDPIVAGLATGLVTSSYLPARIDLEQVTQLTRLFREQPTPELARTAQLGVGSAISRNERLQYRLHAWSSYVIVPLFALANAGITIDTGLLGRAVTSPITLGIVAGYLFGKPLGILSGVWLSAWQARRRDPGFRIGLSWPVIAGGGVVAGIGFTVSLLISSIAFTGERLEEAKVGVLGAALIASLASWGVFRAIARLPAAVRARQESRTAEDLVDLAEEVDPQRDHVRGPDDAAVTLVEYGDYECPHCGQAEVVIRQLLGSFGDDLRYVWRHLPLNDVHMHAQLAAAAAEAAGAQGAFWPMHDRLRAHQDELAPQDLRRYATELGLDVERFTDDLRRHRYAERVAEDVASADASGVAGTPSFFINGRRYSGAYDLDTLSAAVRTAERRARATRMAEPAVD